MLRQEVHDFKIMWISIVNCIAVNENLMNINAIIDVWVIHLLFIYSFNMAGLTAYWFG